MKAWLAFLALTGCTDDDGVLPPAPPAPMTCQANIALDLATHQNEQLQNMALTDAGTTFCVQLDATARTHPTYFDATTPTVSSTHSDFGLAIYGANDALLARGDEVPVGGSTYSTVSLQLDAATVVDVKLVAWSVPASASTSLTLSLYQILD